MMIFRAYDGDRAPRSGSWGDGDAKSWNYGLPWKIGDVAGFACDLDLEASSKTITFYLNGKSMGVAFANVDYACGLTPAMTVVSRGDSCYTCQYILFLDSSTPASPPCVVELTRPMNQQGGDGKSYAVNFGPNLQYLPPQHRFDIPHHVLLLFTFTLSHFLFNSCLHARIALDRLHRLFLFRLIPWCGIDAARPPSSL